MEKPGKKRREPDEVDFRFAKIFASGPDMEEIAKHSLEVLRRYEETGEMPLDLHSGPPPKTPEDRLAYYRSHGLVDCSDYPGGDAQFESDVLSGAERDEDAAAMGPLGKEDAYIIDRMYDGRFVYDGDFDFFKMRPEVLLAYYENAAKHLIFFSSCPYAGGWLIFRRDVLSGEYARKLRADRGLL